MHREYHTTCSRAQLQNRLESLLEEADNQVTPSTSNLLLFPTVFRQGSDRESTAAPSSR